MKIIENGVERDATKEEEKFFEQLTSQEIPPTLQEQIAIVEQQTLDIAEAVTSLYETMLVAGVSV